MERGSKAPVGMTWLEKGDTWKIGETWNPLKRYSQTALEAANLERVAVNVHRTKRLARQAERRALDAFLREYGMLPAGNKMLK